MSSTLDNSNISTVHSYQSYLRRIDPLWEDGTVGTVVALNLVVFDSQGRHDLGVYKEKSWYRSSKAKALRLFSSVYSDIVGTWVTEAQWRYDEGPMLLMRAIAKTYYLAAVKHRQYCLTFEVDLRRKPKDRLAITWSSTSRYMQDES